MMYKKSFSFVVPMALFILHGCATHTNSTNLFDVANATDQQFLEQFQEERKYLGGRKPTLGLALSGGGTRAAYFAHGVLHGLLDAGLLDQVDIISTVSGGGYAAFWYYTKILEDPTLIIDPRPIFLDCFPQWWLDRKDLPNSSNGPQDLKRVFARGQEQARKEGIEICNDPRQYSTREPATDPYRWQTHIRRWPELFRPRIGAPGPDHTSPPLADYMFLFSAALFEPLVSWSNIDSLWADSYQAGIERAWGLNPKPRERGEDSFEREPWVYSNAQLDRWGTQLRMDPDHMRWDKFRELYVSNFNDPKAKNHLPLWIINANSGYREDPIDLKNLYEITPFGHGAIALNYKYELPPLKDIATAVRASAAFFDAQGWPEGGEVFLDAIAKFFPAGRWGVPVKIEQRPDIKRLSDGGGADNLGLLSLIHRRLEDIIIVDAAEDSAGRMKDLCRARELLKSENIDLKFDSLEDFDELCEKQTALRSAKSEDPGTLESGPYEQYAYNVSAWLNPVVKGEAIWRNSNKKTRLWLIKLAWNQKVVRDAYNQEEPMCGADVHDIPCGLLLFYGHNTKIRDDSGHMVFPQLTTVGAVLKSSKNLFYAFRELGRMHARHLMREQNRGSLMSACKTESLQPRRIAKSGERPEEFIYTKIQPKEVYDWEGGVTCPRE